MNHKNINVQEIIDTMAMEYIAIGVQNRYIIEPAPIDEARDQSISFCSDASEGAIKMIHGSKAGVIICSRQLHLDSIDIKKKTLLLVDDPRLAFIRVMNKYFKEVAPVGVHPMAILENSTDSPSDIYIGPNSHIESSVIGNNCRIYSNVHVYKNVRIGKNVCIYDGAVVGKEGTSYAVNEYGRWEKFPHIGGVIIEDCVDIGANTVIDRGTFSNTRIGKGTKINNLSHIGHNVTIGSNCLISVHNYIGGNSKIGNDCWLAPGAVIRNGITLGNNVVVAMGAVVTRSVKDNCVAMGIPAQVVSENIDKRWRISGVPMGIVNKV